MRYYVDKRIMEVVKETDIDIDFMAPETYYEYACSAIDNIITEVWYVKNNKRINVSYPKEESPEITAMKRESIFKENNVEPLFLLRFEVPKDWFEAAIKHLQ